jgi:Ca2+-binding RTX toxin-like protein
MKAFRFLVPAMSLAFTSILIGAAPVAAASNASVSGGVLTWVAATGVVNEVLVTHAAGNVTINDLDDTITPGTGCSAVDPNTVSCADTGITSLDMSSLDKSDRIYNESDIPSVLRGGDGFDLLQGDEAADEFIGGTGFDTVSYHSRNPAVSVSLDDVANDGEFAVAPGEGDNVHSDIERVIGGDGNDILVGSDGDETLIGKDGGDLIDGGAGADRLLGDLGSDRILAAWDGAADYMDGGDGFHDVVEYHRPAGVSVSLDDVDNDGAANEHDNVTSTVEDVITGPGADTITGSASSNILAGGGGNDLIMGGAGNDDLRGGSNNDILRGGDGADLIAGNAGRDTADYSLRIKRVVVRLDGLANDGRFGEHDNVNSSTDYIIGGAGNDELDGDADNNHLSGRDGKDTIFGRAGNDTLFGGFGFDALAGGSGTDACFPGPGGGSKVNCE